MGWGTQPDQHKRFRYKGILFTSAFRDKNIRSRLRPLLCLLILFNRPFDKQTRRRV